MRSRLVWAALGAAVGWCASYRPQGGQAHADARVARERAERERLESNAVARIVAEARFRQAKARGR